MSKINDGKYLEEAIKKELDKIKISTFRYRRLNDTRAARNIIVAQPADFFLADGWSAHLEAKSVSGKTLRLPMFDQYAEMRDWDRAGVYGYVLIHFWEPDVFCVASINDLEPAPSWSFKSSPKYSTVNEALRAILGDILPA